MPADLRPSIDDALEAFGVPATVTRPAPDDTPIQTTGFWITPRQDEQPYGTDVTRAVPRQVLVLPKATVPTLPLRTTRIDAPEFLGGPLRQWRSDGLSDAAEWDCWHVIVMLNE